MLWQREKKPFDVIDNFLFFVLLFDLVFLLFFLFCFVLFSQRTTSEMSKPTTSKYKLNLILLVYVSCSLSKIP